MHRYRICLLLLLASILLTGCWSRKELNELSLVIGLGIDKDAETGQYMVSAQTVYPSNTRSAGESVPVAMFTANGKTVSEALRRMMAKTPRYNYFAHLRILFISEQVAKEGVGKPLDFLSRNRQFRNDFFLAIVRGTKASDMMSVLTPIEKLPANYMYKSLEVSAKEWAPSIIVKLNELVAAITTSGFDPVVPAFRLSGDAREGGHSKNLRETHPPVHYSYGGVAIFRGDKLVGWLNESEARGYTFLTNNIKRALLTIPCEKGQITLATMRARTIKKVKLVDGKPQFDLYIQSEGNIEENECAAPITTSAQLAELQKQAEEFGKQYALMAVDKAKKSKADILGLGETLHQTYPRYWRKVEPQWQDIWPDAPIRVRIQYRIKQIGSINKSIPSLVEENENGRRNRSSNDRSSNSPA